MTPSPKAVSLVLQWAQRRLLWLLLSCYLLGGLIPGPGAAMRGICLGTLSFRGGGLSLTLPLVMLSFMLFTAGLGVRLKDLVRVLRRPAMLLAGLAANAAIPVLFTLGLVGGLRLLGDSEQLQCLLIGLALVAAMPIAGASTAWSQNSEGNLALSLGLVVVSTLMSPLLTPLVFKALAPVASGEYLASLDRLAGSGTQLFLLAGVVVPSVAGMGLRQVLPGAALARWMPVLKLANLSVLLALNYSNAALSLQPFLSSPDLGYLACVLLVASLLCALAFQVGSGVARLFRGAPSDEISLMFGLGMNNNGTGLVLASTALGNHPMVLLPILAYNVVQQVAAGLVDARSRALRETPTAASVPAPVVVPEREAWVVLGRPRVTTAGGARTSYRQTQVTYTVSRTGRFSSSTATARVAWVSA